MIFPISAGATLISIMVEPARGTSRTSTASTSSTRALTIISTVSRIDPQQQVAGSARAPPGERKTLPRKPALGFGSRRLRFGVGFDQPSHRVGWLRAFFKPVTNTIGVELNLRRIARRIVRAQVLQIGAVAFRLLFLHHNTI